MSAQVFDEGPAALETPGARGRVAFERAAPAMRAWLHGVTVAVLGLVAVGGITRLTQSGLSIVEWRPVTGVLPPRGPEAWAEAFARYRQHPQFHLQFHGALTLEQFRGLYFWEWLHRLLARLVVLAYAAPLAVVFARVAVPVAWRRRLLAVLGLFFAQGALGWFMVASGLVSMPRVSHYRLAAHLLLALTTASALHGFAFALAPRPRDAVTTARPLPRWPSTALAALVVLQLAWGAFTAGLRAGYGYPTWPTMNGAWIPSEFWRVAAPWSALLAHAPAVQFVHRWLGVLVLFVALGYAGYVARVRGRGASAAGWVAALSLAQCGLGVATLRTHIALPVAVAHQVGGALVLLAAVRAVLEARATGGTPRLAG